jgi:hypothetical protein
VTGRTAGALTVAGQWRNFTAFPNILAIAEWNVLLMCVSSLMAWKKFPCHEYL